MFKTGLAPNLYHFISMFVIYVNVYDISHGHLAVQEMLMITRNNSADVDRRVLLLPAHHVEPETFVRLGQLHDPWVGMTFAGSEGCNRGLGSGGGPGIEKSV